jgi:hypothetical protein
MNTIFEILCVCVYVCVCVIHRFIKFELCRWFHANISKELATALVVQTPADCFLVRFSSQPGHFALTMKHRNLTQGQAISYRIDPRSDGTWTLGENLIFPCLEAVIYNNEMLKNVKPILREDVKRR